MLPFEKNYIEILYAAHGSSNDLKLPYDMPYVSNIGETAVADRSFS